MITVLLQTQEILAKKIAPEGAILGGCYQSLSLQILRRNLSVLPATFSIL
jgi:hypothetical protein